MIRHTILLVLLLAMLPATGCGALQALWPGGGDDVPVTRPVEVTDVEFEQPQQPAGQDVLQPTAAPVGTEAPPVGQAPIPAASQIEPGARVIAANVVRVNDVFLTMQDILVGAGPALSALPQGLSEEEFRRRAVTILQEEVGFRVHEALIVSSAEPRLEESQREAIDRQVERHLRELITEAGGSRTRLEQDLQDIGTDLPSVLASYRRQLIMHHDLRNRFAHATVVSRRELWEEYQRNIDRFTTPRQVQMQIIMIDPARLLPQGVRNPDAEQLAAARTAAREKAREALAEIRAGADFGEVARRVSHDPMASQGGLWPMMPAGSFANRAIEETGFALDEGQIGVVATDEAFLIIRAHRVEPGGVADFAQAQRELAPELRQRRENQLRREYIERLREQASLDQAPQFFMVALDEAVERFWKP